MLNRNSLRRTVVAAVLSLVGCPAMGVEGPAFDPAEAIITRALGATEPATVLDENVDLSAPAMIEALASGLEQVRKKHGPAKTLPFASRLVEAARRTTDQALLARTLSQTAQVLELAGNYDEAIADRDEAAKLYDALKRPGDAAAARNDIGSILEDQGKLAAAEERYRESRKDGSEHWTPQQRVKALLREGTLARVLGRPRDAIDINQQALTIARANNDVSSEARILANLSAIHANLGEYDEALGFGKTSFDLRKPDDYQGRAISLNNLGLIHELQGDKEEALRTYRGAAAEAEKSKEPKGLAITAANVGIQLRKMGRPQEARGHLEEALRIAGDIGFARLRVAARRELGLALIALNEHDAGAALLTESLSEAETIHSTVDLAETQLAIALHTAEDRRPAAERALNLARDAQQPEFEWAALTLLGDIERDAGADGAAIEHYTDAVTVIERLRRQVAGGEIQRQTFFEDKLQPYHALVELHFNAGNRREAFRWIQQTKARVLLDSLELERRQVSTEIPGAQKERFDALRLKIAEADAAKDRAAAESARGELDQLARGLAAPQLLAPLADADAAARKLLDPETALLEYLVLPERTYLSVLTIEHGEPALQIVRIDLTAAEMQRQGEELRAAVATRQLGYESIAAKLWARFVGPAAPQLRQCRRLIVSPSGSLWRLPFQVLRDDENRFLIDRFALSYAPSASSLVQMNAARKSRAKARVLVMSNPARADSGHDFPDLPGSDRLATELPRIYGKEETVVLAGAAATEHAFKARAAESDLLHYAAHGVFDPTTPLHSHLRLAAGDGEDGLLEAREIMNLRLHSSLAVLAACETARGGEGAGEGVIGMSWAFFLAGCPTVIASQWKVDSASMNELSLGFHKQLAGGVSPAIAMQAAAQELRKNRAYRHPFYWAPFVVVGAL